MDRISKGMFSFNYLDLPTVVDYNTLATKKPFVEQVERVLKTDLQQYDVFGCQINNCHTHAGSKIHFNSFIEAELLFHNSYYNKAFAQLTHNWIYNKCLDINDEENICFLKDTNVQIHNILLVGYETYSELYLQELKEILNKFIKNDKVFVDYCVY